jgi:hypothetical protein
LNGYEIRAADDEQEHVFSEWLQVK